MNLSSKITLILLAVAFLYTAMVVAVQRLIVYPGMRQHETRHAVADLQRVESAIEREIHHLMLMVADWAAWNDTYDFIESADARYVESNLVQETFEDAELNLIIFLNSEGEVVWGGVHTPLEEELGESLPIAPEDIAILREALTAVGDEVEPRGGLIRSRWGTLLIAAAPILRNDRSGPSRGTLIMGRVLDENAWDALRDQTDLEFSLHPADLPGMASGRIGETPSGGDRDGVRIEQIDNERIEVSLDLRDIQGVPLIQIRAFVPRDPLLHARGVVHFANLSILLLGLAIGLMILITVRRTVIKPLNLLTGHARAIGEQADLSLRLGLTRGDEIGVLARALDTMLGRIDESNRDRLEQARLYQRAITQTGSVPYEFEHRTDRYTFWGEGIEALTGYTPSELTHRFFNSRVEEMVRQGALGSLNLGEVVSLFNEGGLTLWRADYHFRRRDGQMIWLNDTSVPILDSEGKPVSSLGILTDVTPTRRSLEELKLRDRALAGARSGISITDARDPSFPIIYVNPAFEEITGYGAEEILGTDGRILEGEESDQIELEELHAALEERRGTRILLRNFRKDGSLFWNDLTLAPVRNDVGEVTHFIAIQNDITELRRIEREIIEISENEQRRIGRDIHDGLCQRLTGISLMAGQLASHIRRLGIQDIPEAEAIEHMLGDALVEARAVARGLTPVDLEEAGLTATLDLLMRQVQRLNGITCDMSGNLEALESMSPESKVALYRIVQEAVTNAVKHATAKHITVAIAREERHLQLVVRDDGGGIPGPRDRNSGMGLHTMEYRARMLGGTLRVGLGESGGTEVKCRIPLGAGTSGSHWSAPMGV